MKIETTDTTIAKIIVKDVIKKTESFVLRLFRPFFKKNAPFTALIYFSINVIADADILRRITIPIIIMSSLIGRYIINSRKTVWSIAFRLPYKVSTRIISVINKKY